MLSAGVSIALSGTCSVGALTFSNFSIFAGSTPVSITGFAASVFVTTGLNGLAFSYNNLGNSTMGFDDIQFKFQETPSGLISDIFLSGGSSQNTTESICSTAFNTSESCPGGTVLGTGSAGTGVTVHIAIASNPNGSNSIDYFLKDITGGSGVGQNLTPEPLSLSMVGIGLLGLGALARRRKV